MRTTARAIPRFRAYRPEHVRAAPILPYQTHRHSLAPVHHGDRSEQILEALLLEVDPTYVEDRYVPRVQAQRANREDVVRVYPFGITRIRVVSTPRFARSIASL